MITTTFQNCGTPHTADSVNSSLSTGPVLKTSGATRALDPIAMTFDTTGFAAGTTFLWSHQFSDATKFCEQSTSIDQSESVLSCPAAGSVLVVVTVLHPDGTEDILSTSVTVGGP